MLEFVLWASQSKTPRGMHVWARAQTRETCRASGLGDLVGNSKPQRMHCYIETLEVLSLEVSLQSKFPYFSCS